MNNDARDRTETYRGFRYSRCFMRPLCIFLLMAPAGCGPSINKAQVDRIRLGMTLSEVEDILGKGKSVDGGEVKQLIDSSLAGDAGAAKMEIDMSEFRGIRWGDDKKSVTVIFRANKVFRVFPKGIDK